MCRSFLMEVLWGGEAAWGKNMPPPPPPQLFDHHTFKMPGVFEAMLFICAPTLAV